MNLVYLAGPIANCTVGEAVDWRTHAFERLRYGYDLDVRDPMRAKTEGFRKYGKIGSNFNEYSKEGTFFTSKAIMTRDFNDVKQADALLVNLLGAKTASLGTVMELAWAFALQKPCVVCIEESGNPHDNHPMIHEAMGFRVTTLEEGIHSVAVILGVA